MLRAAMGGLQLDWAVEPCNLALAEGQHPHCQSQWKCADVTVSPAALPDELQLPPATWMSSAGQRSPQAASRSSSMCMPTLLLQNCEVHVVTKLWSFSIAGLLMAARVALQSQTPTTPH